jgi:hypothetical protein
MIGFHLSLLKKILLISLGPFILLGLTLQGINYYLTKINFSFSKTSGQFAESMKTITSQSAAELISMSEQSAKDLLQEIRISIGSSLQPGEAAKFLDLAKKQVEIELLNEFSFYGPDGKLELSSNSDTNKKTVPQDVLQQAKTDKALVIRGKEESDPFLLFYLPLFMDADMIRMNPDYKIGDFYGLLFVEMKKDRIRKSVEQQQKHIEQVMAESQKLNQAVISKSMIWSVSVSGAFLVAVIVLVVPMATRGIVNPLRKAIDANKNIAEYLSSAAHQFTTASQSIASGATEQAAGLEETSSSLEEITTMTKTNAQNAQQANLMAQQAQSAASEGTNAISTMNQAIEDIRKSSESTSKIIKVIDEIAFQTNLLALNAAVEAARAGEAGKGFAVVAEEVRNLAIRSAEAAKNTEQMIQTSVSQSQKGTELSANVSKTLTEILNRSAKTAALVSEIARACTQQAGSIEQINTSISQMENVTQQNAANAEESATSAEELNTQANNLRHTVDELMILVENNASCTVYAASEKTA